MKALLLAFSRPPPGRCVLTWQRQGPRSPRLLIRMLIPLWGPTLMTSSNRKCLPKARLQIAPSGGGAGFEGNTVRPQPRVPSSIARSTGPPPVCRCLPRTMRRPRLRDSVGGGQTQALSSQGPRRVREGRGGAARAEPGGVCCRQETGRGGIAEPSWGRWSQPHLARNPCSGSTDTVQI